MNLFLSINGKQEGPFSLEQVQQMLASGRIRAADLAWRQGAPGWVPLNTLMEIETATGNSPGAGSVNPYAPPSVTAPTPAYPMAAGVPGPNSGAAVTSMVFGILAVILGIAFFPLGFICGVVAVICGHISLRGIARSNGCLQGRGMGIAGLVTGYLGLLFSLLMVLFVVVVFKAVTDKVPEIRREMEREQRRIQERIEKERSSRAPETTPAEPERR